MPRAILEHEGLPILVREPREDHGRQFQVCRGYHVPDSMTAGEQDAQYQA